MRASPLGTMESRGFGPELRGERLYVPATEAIDDQTREFIRTNRQAIVDELRLRAFVGASVARVEVAQEPMPVAIGDAHAWWNAQGWTVAKWLDECAAAGVAVSFDGVKVTLTSRSGYVPPWVCSDRYQLERAGVFALHFAGTSDALCSENECYSNSREQRC